MNKKLFWILSILLAWFGRDGARAQQRQPVTSVQPDCMVFFRLTVASSGAQATPFLPGQTSPPAGSAGTSLVCDDHQVGAYGWTVAYTSFGFTAVSLAFQSAPDNATGTAPGTWSTVAVCGGTECLGINPNTATTSAITTTKVIAPWLRVNLTSKTGTGAVVGVLYGYNINIVSNGGAPSTCPGGLNTQVQYNNAGACAGTSGATATATRLLFADGSSLAPAIAFGSQTDLGFYKLAAGVVGFADYELRFISTGGGSPPLPFIDIQANNIKIGQDIHAGSDITWYNNLGTGGANSVALLSDTNLLFGPFTGGAMNTGIVRDNADGILNIANAGLTKQPLKVLDVRYTGYAFAGLAALVSGTATYCTNCTVVSSIDNTCATGGSGAMANRVNGVWKCSL